MKGVGKKKRSTASKISRFAELEREKMRTPPHLNTCAAANRQKISCVDLRHQQRESREERMTKSGKPIPQPVDYEEANKASFSVATRTKHVQGKVQAL